MLNFNHLYYFYIAGRMGGITAAAKSLRISQPSLSSQLKVLERSLNVKLFRRVGRINQLTESGSIVFGFCRRMFEVSDELSELVLKRLPTVSRRIKIGVSDQVERSFVVEVVSLFLKKHGPEHRPKVTMISGTHEQLVDRLRFREMDAVVTQLPMSDPDLISIMRAETPVSLFCSSRCKFHGKGPRGRLNLSASEWKEGNHALWVVPPATFKLRSEIDSFIEAHELKGRVVFESDVVDSLVRSVVDGIGIAFLPVLYVAEPLRKGNLRMVGPKGGFWKYRVWMGCHAQNSSDPLIRSLGDSFKDVCDRADRS